MAYTIDTKQQVTREVLVSLARKCQRCSVAYNDPYLIETCIEIGEECWEACPACNPNRYQHR